MISKSDTSVEDVLSFYTRLGIDVAFLVPTLTGFGKSIMDATGSVRSFLVRNHIHDYSFQNQGQSEKVMIKAYFVAEDRLIESVASLYRPETKKGDPRIWFKGLKDYCQPNNLLALVVLNKELYVYNMSNEWLRILIGLGSLNKSSDLISERENLLSGAQILRDSSAITSDYGPRFSVGLEIIQIIYKSNNLISAELLSKLRAIYKRGFIPSVTKGDTGVGMTLESLLGIAPNSCKDPDYKGIEIKASRDKLMQQNRVNLFSQAPDWSKSTFTAKMLLSEFGYIIEGRKQLYCTVTANKPNPQSLYFMVDDETDSLFGMGCVRDSQKKLVYWDFDNLRKRLDKKHKETFWVKASVDRSCETEMFQYENVIHTKKPNSTLFSTLIDTGIITMDYTLSEKLNHVRDHGYLFKIKPENVSMLFPTPIFYSLSD